MQGLLGREGVGGDYDPVTRTRGTSPSCPARLHQGVLQQGCSRAAPRREAQYWGAAPRLPGTRPGDPGGLESVGLAASAGVS